MKFCSRVLDNGLHVVAECREDAHSCALGYFVDTGSRDETADVAGVSHFLEHMTFKGTSRRSAEDVNREFDELGAHHNAFTGEEHTVYFAAVLPEHQAAVLDLLTDILRPSLRKEDFDTEKQVIIEEIRMYDDQPPFGAEDKCKAAFFGSHPLAHSVLGTVESIQGLTVEAMRAYFERRYGPNNMVLAAAGRINFDALCRQAESLTSRWRQGEQGRRAVPISAGQGLQSIQREAAAQQYVLHMAAGPGVHDEDRYAAKLVAVVLGDDQASRLYWELVDSGRAETATLAHHEYSDCGVFFTYLSCEPDRAQDNVRRFRDIYARARAEGLCEAELEQAKGKVSSRIVLAGEKPRNRFFVVGDNWLQRREYRSIRDDLNTVQRLSLDDLNAVLKKYSLADGACVTVGPARIAPGNG